MESLWVSRSSCADPETRKTSRNWLAPCCPSKAVHLFILGSWVALLPVGCEQGVSPRVSDRAGSQKPRPTRPLRPAKIYVEGAALSADGDLALTTYALEAHGEYPPPGIAIKRATLWSVKRGTSLWTDTGPAGVRPVGFLPDKKLVLLKSSNEL